ncbi:MAG: formate dehydrogenase [Comamonadaceae bacterium]|nr:MAG: formate dehydrogenase [Comamonadaceae bacterium]
MSHDNLVRMANQIGVFFGSQPDRDEALEGLAMHLKKFWAPPMRGALLAVLDGGSEGEQPLDPVVVEALNRHRGLLAAVAPVASEAPVASGAAVDAMPPGASTAAPR